MQSTKGHSITTKMTFEKTVIFLFLIKGQENKKLNFI